MRNQIFTIMMGVSLCAMAYNTLPTDPDVKIGHLDNGLTYYIRHNETPAGQADFFLAQCVGSLNEEENQGGLAHFLEHMCFNGTENFPGNSLIDYLESIGVKFGANLNAYTSTDRTVYNISSVPTARTTSVDSCMMILRDWSGRLLLKDQDIDEERGVIVGEWRQKNAQPSSRLLEKAAPEIYAGSLYGQRMPIGLMDVVENFKYDELRDYYHKWYHPQNQCVIVVGDIDPAHVEDTIKQMWSDAKTYPTSVVSEKAQIPANSEIISTLQTDPEQGQTMVQLFIKHDGETPEEENTIVELRREVMASMVAEMLAERYDEVENTPGAPFSNLGVGDMKFLLASHQPAMQVRAQAQSGQPEKTVEAMAKELKRAAAQGFTDTELTRAKLNARAEADARFSSASKATNTVLAKRYAEHFLEGGMLPSEEQRYKMIKGVIGQISVDDVNKYIKSVVCPDDRNVVIICYAPTSTTASASSLKNAYAGVDGGKLEAYVDKFAGRPIMAQTPEAGKIVEETIDPVFGNKVWTLSNGIRVNIRHSKSDPDMVYISAKSPGGISQHYTPELASCYLALNDVLALSSVGQNTATDLRKLLAGKNVKTSAAVEKMEEELSASAAKSDLEEAFQILYLRATDLHPDTAAFNTYLASQRLKIDGQTQSAVHAMSDSIHANVFDHHPLGGERLHHADLPKIDYGTILDIWRDRFGDMSDFTYYVAGDFDEDSLRSYVEKYVASLPAAGRMERQGDMGYHYAKGREHKKYSMPMESEQAITYTFYNGPCEYSLENVIKGNIFGTILKDRLRKDLRESRGWTYGISGHAGVSAGMNADDPSNLIMPVYIKVAPENTDSTFEIVGNTVDEMCMPGAIKTEELAKATEYMAKNYSENADDNGYWITVMRMRDKFGKDMHSDYLNILNAITPDDISAFGAKYLANANRLRLQMTPE